MKLKARLDALRKRPRDPNAIPLSALDPMSKAEIAAHRNSAKARMDAALPVQHRPAHKAVA